MIPKWKAELVLLAGGSALVHTVVPRLALARYGSCMAATAGPAAPAHRGGGFLFKRGKAFQEEEIVRSLYIL